MEYHRSRGATRVCPDDVKTFEDNTSLDERVCDFTKGSDKCFASYLKLAGETMKELARYLKLEGDVVLQGILTSTKWRLPSYRIRTRRPH